MTHNSPKASTSSSAASQERDCTDAVAHRVSDEDVGRGLSGASMGRDSSDGGDMRQGFQEASTCAVCNAKLGKRHLNRRHHCRICNSSVCSACSPNLVQIPGARSLQRACNACVALLPQNVAVGFRLARVRDRLFNLGVQRGDLVDARPTSLEDCVGSCEELVSTVEDYVTALQSERDCALRQARSSEQRVQSAEAERDAADKRARSALAERDAALKRAGSQKVASTSAADPSGGNPCPRPDTSVCRSAGAASGHGDARRQSCVKRCVLM